MRILFTLAIPFVLEPMGVLLLSSLCKRDGHKTALTIIKNDDFIERVKEFDADVVAYSVIGGDIEIFKEADKRLRKHIQTSGKRIFRIMGGPHPTYSPQVLDEMQLDAICWGDGDHAFPELLRRLQSGDAIEDIPNIAVTSKGPKRLEKLGDREMDMLPYADRELYFDAVPFVRPTGLRSFITSRGCPFSCAYCYNNAYNMMFKGTGPIVRRQSVDKVLEEIEYNIREFPPVKFIRFFDDTFALTADAWLKDFAEKYPKRIGLPFYCLMRPNTFTEDTAKLLAKAGCYSVAMAVEAGTEAIRNDILGRGLSDEQMMNAFALSRKYNLRTYGNTMIGIPGTTLNDDFVSLEFARNLRVTVPTFTVCSPSRGTHLAEIAESKGLLDSSAEKVTRFANSSPLNCYTKKEKEIQTRICYFGSIYCQAPEWMRPFLMLVIKRKIMPMKLARHLGFISQVFTIGYRVFPHAIPKSPLTLLRVAYNGVRYFL